jgi:hypothetical protein
MHDPSVTRRNPILLPTWERELLLSAAKMFKVTKCTILRSRDVNRSSTFNKYESACSLGNLRESYIKAIT